MERGQVRELLEVDQVEPVRVNEIDARKQIMEPSGGGAGDLGAQRPVSREVAFPGREVDRPLDDRDELAVDPEVARGQQDRLVARLQQPPDQVRDDQLGAAVAAGRHRDVRAGHHRDAH